MAHRYLRRRAATRDSAEDQPASNGWPWLSMSMIRSLSESCHSTAANDPQASALFSAQNIPQRIPANTPPDVSSLRPCICQQLLCLATKDYSEPLLAVLDPRVTVFPFAPRDRFRPRQCSVLRASSRD